MTVAELIKLLQQMPQDAEVVSPAVQDYCGEIEKRGLVRVGSILHTDWEEVFRATAHGTLEPPEIVENCVII